MPILALRVFSAWRARFLADLMFATASYRVLLSKSRVLFVPGPPLSMKFTHPMEKAFWAKLGARMASKKVSGFKLMLKTSVVSGMTFLSRILGLIRDIVFARFFGASLVMDAFIVANRIPNMLRRFFAEGAFSQGFVPVMARYREKHSHEDAREFVDSVAGTFGVILFLVTLAGVVAAPLLVAVVAPGFIGSDGRFELATLMLRFTFPYLFFVSLTAFAGGILNTYGRFAVPAFTPVILNIVLIAGAV